MLNGKLQQRIFRILLVCCWLIPLVSSAAPQIMLPQVDTGEQDVTGWLMSEKLDGVRGYWDGQQLWSKGGKLLHPPADFLKGLPDFALEGELWGGRATFENTASTVLKQHPHDGWLQLKFGIFDVPGAAGEFTKRIDKALVWFKAHPSPYAFVIPQISVLDRAQLNDELQRVELLCGEGLIVRSPDALYATGRSPEILKVKDFEDTEAVVLAHIPGQGKNLGRLGSLLVELPDGTRFKVGTGFSDAERDNPPPVGTTITFKFYGYYQSGIPKFPSFLRIRHDRDLQ